MQPRFGAADESQLSVRGSGLRNNFHARGINLLVNGMPYRNADGFTDFESLELLTTEAIEVYKGANAFRYGGSTLGGAIDLETKTGLHRARRSASFARRRELRFLQGRSSSSGGERGAFDYYASYARTLARRLSRLVRPAARPRQPARRLRLSPSTDAARLLYLRACARAAARIARRRDARRRDPRAADPGNVANQWGRDYTLHHLGVQLRAQLSATQRLEISPYMQYRDIDHPIFEVIRS